MTSRQESSPRSLDAPLLSFDLRAELTRLKVEPTWKTAHRNAVTLVKTAGLRVVLIAMHADTAIPGHVADGPIAVQVVDGRLRFDAGNDKIPMESGQMVTLQPQIPHSLTAVSECAFLLTIGGELKHPAE
ncbi:MAG: hypothetical protein B6D46_03340 [Polyangiaceae bacterium UTPRO1]|jgi:quercetin dioxygenase-like cupin family protein|nr:cupin domain-containing protein [Myxococcales bacterium]OQY68442.1 MAG: hypothetical protein B6D46_03340 [Polyangiaceae bacterium UTPRO1]